MDLLKTPKFAIPLFYGSFSMVMYAIVTVLIFASGSKFKGSFFKLFVFGFFMNLWTYCNSFVTLRVPQNTRKNGSFARFFESHGMGDSSAIPMSFFHMWHYHFAYTQYAFNTLMCLNRTMIVFYPFKCEIFWQKWFFVIVSLLFVSPFAATLRIFMNESYYVYAPLEDYYAINTTYGRAAIYAALMPTLMCITITNIALNCVTFCKVFFMNKQNRRTMEVSLLFMSFSVFVIDMFLSSLSLLNYWVTATDPFLGFMVRDWDDVTKQRVTDVTQLLTPFASDLLTFSHPWLLIVFSKQIQRALLQFFGLYNDGKSSTPVNVIAPRRADAWD